MEDSDNTVQHWRRVCLVARAQLHTTQEQEQFDEFIIKGGTLSELSHEQAVIAFENRHNCSWAEDHYVDVLTSAFSEVEGRAIVVRFRTSLPSSTPTPAPSSTRPTIGYNRAMHFDNFIVGSCNRVAHAAALAVARNPANPRWNPLYLYGATGLGKTHLLNAIGNEINRQHPAMEIVYVTSEDFVNDYVLSVRHQRTESFRLRFREEAKVLLIDDIQFLRGKDGTQEELFNVFNVLASQGRQMVFTSDVPPGEIEGLEPRLKSRMQAGQVVGMQAPDYETARAILEQRAQSLGLTLASDLADLIAHSVHGNVRELLGVLNNLEIYMSAHGLDTRDPITLSFAQNAIPQHISPPRPSVSVDDIIAAIARFNNIAPHDITGKNRSRHFTKPRHLAMYLARKHTDLSLPRLGEAFGGRDHTSIMHGVKKITEGIELNDADLNHQISMIERQLRLRT